MGTNNKESVESISQLLGTTVKSGQLISAALPGATLLAWLIAEQPFNIILTRLYWF